MSKENKSFENIPWMVIKNYLSHTESSELNEEHKYLIDRVFSLARVLDRHPQRKSALALHRAKYTDISCNTASNDLAHAMKLNNTTCTFNYPFWQNWLINDCIDQIQAAKAAGDLHAWSAGHRNFIKIIGEKPVQPTDPKLVEKHTFLIQINHKKLGPTIDVKDLDKIPMRTREEISASFYGEITEEDANQIFTT